MPGHKHFALFRTLTILLLLAISGALISAFGNGKLAAILVLALAFAKGCFVILDFLEMRGTSGALKPALLAWPAILLSLACARSVAVHLFF